MTAQRAPLIEASSLMKGCFIFVMLLMSVIINVEDNVVARLGLEANYLVVALIAVVITGLIIHRNLLLIVLVMMLSIGANMPEHFILNFGVDRDYMTGVLAASILTPLIAKLIEQ